MKTLELNQMEMLEAGSFWSGFLCAGTIIAAGSVIYGTGGLGTAIAAEVLALGCGGMIGWDIYHN